MSIKADFVRPFIISQLDLSNHGTNLDHRFDCLLDFGGKIKIQDMCYQTEEQCSFFIVHTINANIFQAVGSPIEPESAAGNGRSPLNRAIELKQIVEVEKTKLKDVNDRNMHTWWSEFKDMMDEFNKVKEELICVNNPLLLDLLEKLKNKIAEVRNVYWQLLCELCLFH